MTTSRMERDLAAHVQNLEKEGTAKGAEAVTIEVVPATADRGPR